MDKEILVELSQPTTVGPLQPQKPDRSITKPGTLVTPESDHHEYKSLQQLNQKQNTEIKFVSKISKKIHEDWKKGFNAMLNSKYGTVHFGIADDCLVEEGIPLTEKDKDEIHVRVSQSFETFFPSVIEHSTFGIDFIKMENGLFRFDVYIERKSSPYTVFMSRDNSIAYWRSGGRCARIPVDAIQDRSGTQIRKTLEDPDQHEMNTDTNTESSVDETKVSIQHLSLLCIKLQELNAEWEQFGSMLHVKFDTLQQIKSNPERLSLRNKMTSVLHEWKKAKGEKTWRVIYDAVKKLNNRALAERIQQLHDLDSTVGTDKEDYIGNMLKTLEEVIPQYNKFGLHLGLHHNALQEIDGGKLTAEECMKQLIVTWIREKGDKATIYEIIKACRRMNNHYLAEKLENDSEIKKTLNGEPQVTSVQKPQRVKPVISKGDDIDSGVSPHIKVFISYY